MAPARVRVWDLTGPADARSFLRASGVGKSPERLPLPCRAVLIPIPMGFSPNELQQRLPAGVTMLVGTQQLLVAGSRQGVWQLRDTWPEPISSGLGQALNGYERRDLSLRFSDGERWHLAARTRVMGILNVTPDSFSDGGLFATPPRALRHAAEMAEQGAEIVDVGGESTRPGAEAVPVEEECRRVLPVIEAIQRERLGIRVSIDTRRADVAARALDAGADMVNDVSGLGDPQMLPLVAARGCPIVIMHMRGRPRDMQLDTRYVDLVGEILAALGERADQARRATMTDDRIVIDPGIGFGKSATGNEEILRQLGSIRTLGLPIMIGVSRKSFIGHRTGIRNPGQRLSGSLAAATAAVLAGACLVRAHDVGATRQALDVADALRPWVESTYTAEAG